MSAVENIITENLPLWSSSVQLKSTQGRGSSSKRDLYGVKKLRELILDLAVRGLLVPQDPNDEPASALLEKITAEKEKLIIEGKIKNKKSIPTAANAEKLFILPKSWSWVNLGSICSANTGFAFKSSQYLENGTFVLRVTNINPEGTINLLDNKYIDPNSIIPTYEKYILKENDVLLVMVGGSLGKIGIVSKHCLPAVLNQNMWRLDKSSFIELKYFVFGLKLINRSQIEITKSTHGHLSQGDYLNKFFPLPPLAEQHRIVAKVDELMALCDTLEQKQENSIEAHETLVETLLSALTNALDAAAFQSAWERVSKHFDTLLTTEHSVDKLKETILQLAVMGKLVPQDPNDEPASVLLKDIAAKKEQMIKNGDINKQKTSTIGAKDIPFTEPAGWQFSRLINLTKKLGSGSTPRGGKSVYTNQGIPFLRSQNIWNDGLHLDDIAFIPPEIHESMSNTHVYTDDILLNITGASLGRSVIFKSKYKSANVSQHVTIIRLIDLKMSPFIHLVIRSPYVQSLVWKRQVGMAIEGLSKKVLEQFEFPIPPLAEQHRIVAKVDELMALCDDLKQSLNEAQSTQMQLTDAVVESAI